MSHRKVLFICSGNICRSPTAEGVARRLAEQSGLGDAFEFDSAGIHRYHLDEPPDPRTVAAAARRGYDLTQIRARCVTEFDFVRFDHVLAMDRGHLDYLQRACPRPHLKKLGLFLEFSDRDESDEVPDPYYGSQQDFDNVLDQIEYAATRLILRLSAE